MGWPFRGDSRRSAGPEKAITLLITLAIAAGLSLTLYLAVTSIPFLAQSPTTDPLFGGHNACILSQLKEPRVGFAVSTDGLRVFSYGGTRAVLCSRDGPDVRAQTVELSGITGASFDFSGTLWLTTVRGSSAGPSLWRLASGQTQPVPVGEVSPTTVVGDAQGALVLEMTGRLLSVSSRGVGSWAQLGGAVGDSPLLAVNADGTLVMMLSPTGVFIYETATLKRLYFGKPCDVTYAWWGAGADMKDTLLLACAPSWALGLNGRTGQTEAVSLQSRVPSVLIPGLSRYVQSCNAVPCGAPPP
jgi:hypothetical protein